VSEASIAGEAVSLVVPPEVVSLAIDQVGAFFANWNGVDEETLAAYVLDTRKAETHAAMFRRCVTLEAKKVLEVGPGFGTNLALWIKAYVSVLSYGDDILLERLQRTFRFESAATGD
jgi:hypothetical protein